jgi:Holliday junction resolvasome RuvABC endonuclease subunit
MNLKNRLSQQYYSLTPKKTNFCIEQPEEQNSKPKKRLSALLTSINMAFTETKQKEAAIHQRYFQKSYKNCIRISDIRRDLG